MTHEVICLPIRTLNYLTLHVRCLEFSLSLHLTQCDDSTRIFRLLLLAYYYYY